MSERAALGEEEATMHDHEKGCHFLRANPVEGDEAALCNCGYYEEKYLEWLNRRVKAAVEAFRERTEFNAYASDMAAALAAADSVDPHRERLRESLEFVKRPLARNSSNGYVSCQNCGHGWFPDDGEPETHDSRCPHVVLLSDESEAR